MKRTFPLGRVDLALLLVAVLWGFNMPVMKFGMGRMPPLAFNWLRFALSVPMAWALLGALVIFIGLCICHSGREPAQASGDSSAARMVRRST